MRPAPHILRRWTPTPTAISMRQEGDDGYRLDRLDKIDALLLANPGVIWLVGNEPDRVDVQDDMVPCAYAAGDPRPILLYQGA